MTRETIFRAWILTAQCQLRLDHPQHALYCLGHALREANRLSPAHRRVTMRAMNWTRAAAKATG